MLRARRGGIEEELNTHSNGRKGLSFLQGESSINCAEDSLDPEKITTSSSCRDNQFTF